MKVKLLTPTRILHNPGDVVDVPPEVARNLEAIGQAVPVVEKETAKRKTGKK